ncbi:MAG TPA: hypothetical protein VGS15_06940 [Candidatus Acidoferrales bacterium]|nr:hypothetical protein [Candidatus Acidoferrales bacterium]
MEILDYVFGDNYLAASSLPPELEKKAAALRGAGPVDEDAVRSALERARLDKVAIADGTKTLDKLFGEAREADAVVERARLVKATSDSMTPDAIQRRVVLAKLVGEDDESEAPVAEETVADPTWHAVLGKSGNPDARLSRPQRRADVFKEPQKAEGEPLAHPDGTVERSWPEGKMSVTWKNGKIIGSRTEYQSADGMEVEFYDGTGDEITEGEYARLVA